MGKAAVIIALKFVLLTTASPQRAPGGGSLDDCARCKETIPMLFEKGLCPGFQNGTQAAGACAGLAAVMKRPTARYHTFACTAIGRCGGGFSLEQCPEQITAATARFCKEIPDDEPRLKGGCNIVVKAINEMQPHFYRYACVTQDLDN